MPAIAPTYSAMATSQTTAATNPHLLQVMAGASLNLRVKRIRVKQIGNATTGGRYVLGIFRLTSAGTGGGAITPAPFRASDGASGAAAMSSPSSKGSEGSQLMETSVVLRQGVATAGSPTDDFWEWVPQPGEEPIFIPAGAANGIAVKGDTSVAGSTLDVLIEFTEAAY